MTTYLDSMAPDDVARRHRAINDALLEQSQLLADLASQVDSNGRVPGDLFYAGPINTITASTANTEEIPA